MRHNRWFLISLAAAVTLLAAAWYFNVRPAAPSPAAATDVPQTSAPAEAVPDDLSRGLLEQVQSGSPERGAGASTSQGVPTDRQLEDAYAVVDGLQQQIGVLKREAAAAEIAGDKQAGAQKLAALKAQVSVVDQKLASLESDLKRARAVRPDEPVVQWLTGELLMTVGGEPEEVLPFFERATRGGWTRPDALASMARVQLDANQFEAAYQTAAAALKMDDHSPKVWEVFGGIALATGRFNDVLMRIESVYPQEQPSWLSPLHVRARMLQDAWAKEEALRRRDDAAGNLPRVRLTIEHRAFEQGADGRRLTTTKATGRDDVELELFDREAPATVANFLTLVERGFYDGTRFHWAEAASMVVGGDPNSRNADPSDDGLGGPGYVIPDEFALPDARPHFRGSVAMVESGAHTAGSQFFIELAPHPEMNRHLTVFGRVVRGQEGVDRIVPGRTNMRLGRFGKNIPGDVLVHAAVVRKRRAAKN